MTIVHFSENRSFFSLNINECGVDAPQRAPTTFYDMDSLHYSTSECESSILCALRYVMQCQQNILSHINQRSRVATVSVPWYPRYN